MRPGKAEAMRDMCNPKRFGKHIHCIILLYIVYCIMYYTHSPFISVQLHLFIIHEDLRLSYYNDLFSPVVTTKSRKFKINCLLVLNVETTLKHSYFLTANGYPCMIFKLMMQFNLTLVSCLQHRKLDVSESNHYNALRCLRSRECRKRSQTQCQGRTECIRCSWNILHTVSKIIK